MSLVLTHYVRTCDRVYDDTVELTFNEHFERAGGLDFFTVPKSRLPEDLPAALLASIVKEHPLKPHNWMCTDAKMELRGGRVEFEVTMQRIGPSSISPDDSSPLGMCLTYLKAAGLLDDLEEYLR